MALSLLHKYCVHSSSSRPSLFIKSRFLSSNSFLFSAEPSYHSSSSSTSNTPLLEVKDLSAEIVKSNQEILKGVNLKIDAGEIHTIAGKDGSGKSTLLKVLLGYPDYRVTGGRVLFKGKNLFDLNPEERSSTGGFMRFTTANARRSRYEFPNKPHMNAFMQRYLGILSCGSPIELADLKAERERRKDVRLVAVLGGELGILDEIYYKGDEMVDVIGEMNKLLAPKYSSLMIREYRRLLDFILPEAFMHIMEDGLISNPPTCLSCYDMFKCPDNIVGVNRSGRSREVVEA